ncbi:hypothetical protein GF357_02480 [Candidatus Dojkabacteria bacterium]|nr:hypothetical protein [Candidatus Dojkabacteria bacterium]
MKKIIYLITIILSVCSHSKSTANINDYKSKIQEKININSQIMRIDLNLDGKNDIVMNATRNHINAHSFEVHTFYINQKCLKKINIF